MAGMANSSSAAVSEIPRNMDGTPSDAPRARDKSIFPGRQEVWWRACWLTLVLTRHPSNHIATRVAGRPPPQSAFAKATADKGGEGWQGFVAMVSRGGGGRRQIPRPACLLPSWGCIRGG